MSLPIEKRKFVQNYIRSAWDDYTKSGYSYFYNDRHNIAEIRSYMNGSIDPLKYQNIIVPKELANEDSSWININWKPLDIYTKYRRITIQIAMAMKEEMAVEIIDSMAVDEKNEIYSDVMAQLMLKDKLEEAGVDPSLVGLTDDLPENQKELDMFMEFSYKHVAAVEIETILKLIKSRNKFEKETYRKLIEDLHDIGVAVVRDYEEQDGEIKADYVNPEFFFTSYVVNRDFSDAEYMGEIKRMTIAECYREAIYEDENEKIRELELLKDNDYMPNDFKYRDRRKILSNHQDLSSPYLNVVHCQFISGETEEFEIRVTKNGNKVFGRKSGGEKGKEFISAEYDILYEGYWVIGTDCFFGIKKCENVLRDPMDVKKAKFSYTVYAPEMHHMRLNSIGKQVMPSIDSLNIAFYKLQNAILKARPKGVAYDLSSLESVPFGSSDLTPEKNIVTYMMTGNLAVRAVDEDGNMQRIPIQELAGGIGSEGREFMEQIAFNENMFRSITGLNELVDGSTPNPKTLKSVAQQAQIASNNAIKHIHDSCQNIELRLSESIIQRVQDQAEGEDIEFYAPALGKNTVEFFKITKDHSMRSLGLRFDPMPSQEEEERFQQALQLALTTPKGGEAQITIAQKTMLEQIDNKKYAMMYLSYIVDKNLQMAEQRNLQMMQAKSQSDAQAAQIAEEEKRKTLQMDAQIKLALIDREYQYKLRIAGIDSGGKIQQDQIKAQSRDRESMRMNETKVAIEQMKKEELEEEIPEN